MDASSTTTRALCAGKQPGDQLFDLFDAQDLNRELKELMDGLSAKVFRTYNASITLQQQLEAELDAQLPVERKRSAYDEANKQVREPDRRAEIRDFRVRRWRSCATTRGRCPRRTATRSSV